MRTARYLSAWLIITLLVAVPIVIVLPWLVPDGAVHIAAFVAGVLVGIPVSIVFLGLYYGD